MRVAVIGDVIFDEYTYGSPLGLSAETPTIVAKQEKVEWFVGGAGLVVRHLLRLGCDVKLFSVGDFRFYKWDESTDPPTREELTRLKNHSWAVDTWSYTTKKRYFVGDYKVVQFDILNEGKWKDHNRNDFAFYVRDNIKDVDAVVVCDNRHGLLDRELAQKIVSFAKDAGKPVYVDSQVSQKSSNHDWYGGADFIMMNERELDSFICSDDIMKCMVEAGLQEKIDWAEECLRTKIILKAGAEGAYALVEEGLMHSWPLPVQAVDTCGAGDAFLAAFVSSQGEDFRVRLNKANTWAGLSCQKYGTRVPEVE